jgi:hypothetical protein
MCLKVTRLERNKSKAETPVKITFANFNHNHPLTKEMLIKALRSCHQYTISEEACLFLMKLMQAGPIPTMTIRAYLQEHVPKSQQVTATQVCNFRQKVSKLMSKYTDVNQIPYSHIKRVFDPSSLELAEEGWCYDPKMADIFQEAMVEVLVGDGNVTSPNDFAIAQIMEKIKGMQVDGYGYSIYTDETGRPTAILQMTPKQKRALQRYGDVFSLDAQAKVKNVLGWVFMSLTSTNNFNKLDNFGDCLTLQETDRIQVWIIREMYRMAGRPLSSILVIAVDGKLDEGYLRRNLPGK